ncbi:conserved hypothetical protein [Mesorhizobium plurifarium]|uniref:Uncharacterized protein n=1 Tax=Mesorhizobium plurifarium TaxID=69974 RepID=A0A090G5Q9_MESPL|nr:conserved hypothetical protein [Mesorhizobium plurifarium]
MLVMYITADGNEVWLRSSTRMTYISVSGVIETSNSYDVVRSTLRGSYTLLSNISSDDAFLVEELTDEGALVFCLRPDKHCALLLLGKFGCRREGQKPFAVLENLVEVIENRANEIGRRVGAPVRFEIVQPELAMRAE